MSKTVLLLNGRTVILTDDGGEGHGLGLAGEAPDQAKGHPGAGGVMQVTVGGQGRGGEAVVHRVLGHSLLHPGDPASRSAVAEGGFVPLQGSGCLAQQQAGPGEVFTLAQLLPHTTEDEASASTGQQQGSSVQGLDGLGVRVLPASEEGQAKGVSTLVAIIQAEDGTSQTIELTPEDACQLGLPQLLQDTSTTSSTTLQPLPDPLVLAATAGEAAHPHQAPECVPVFPEGQAGPGVGQEAVGGEGEEADVSLGPLLLIPEYNADGSIATVMQIRGSGAEAVPDTARPSEAPGHSTALLATTDAPARPSHSVQKIRLPLAPQVPPAPAPTPRKQSCLRAVAPEVQAMAQPGPRVPSTSLLRDAAKRTKFRNLTSLLEARQDPPATRPPTPPQPAPAITSAGPGPATTTSVSLYHPTTTTTTTTSPLPSLSQDLASTFTIKVNTGPINTTATTTTDTATTTSAPAVATPSPSIKCAEAEGVEDGPSLSEGDQTSLTSIVYSASGHDDTPFAVHLPGGDNTKPLGSSENPIQLVQQGNTFQALQPVQERQLEQITTLLQQRRISGPLTTHRDEIFDPKTNMKIVYKVVYPEHEEDTEDHEEEEEEEDEEVDVGSYIKEEEEEEEALESQNILGKKRGRKPKKTKLEEDPLEDYVTEDSWEGKQPCSRTRSGRISRPPRHMVKDFKHLRPPSYESAKDRAEGGEDADSLPPEPEKVPEPVIADLPRRKKRAVPALTRLRYTCATCGKLYMGRIEAHYRQFPDHCRKPLSEGDHKPSYSAIRSLSEAAKSSGDDASEIKSVLSPTPGTQASDTNSEPGLPMETLTALTTATTQPQDDPLGMRVEFEDPQQPPVTPRRGRGRRKGRGRSRGGRRVGRPPRTSTSLATLHPKPIKVLEKILSSYTSQDIQSAVGQRLFQNLSPWQMLCLQVDRDGAWPQWQDRLRLLEDLLKECREEFHSQTEPLPRPSSSPRGERDLCASPRVPDRAGNVSDRGGKACDSEVFMRSSVESLGVKGSGQTDSNAIVIDGSGGFERLGKGSGGDFLCAKGEGGTEADFNSTLAREEGTNFEVSNYLANILGVMSCEYQLKSSPSSTPSPVPPLDSYLPQLTTVTSGKRPLDEEGCEDVESPPKKLETDSDVTMSQEPDSIKASISEPVGRKYSITMDCISMETPADKPSVSMGSVGITNTNKLEGSVSLVERTDELDKDKYGGDLNCVSMETATDNASMGMGCVGMGPDTVKSKDKFTVGLDAATDKPGSKFSLGMDSVRSALEAATCNLPLSAYSLPDVTASHTEPTPGILSTSTDLSTTPHTTLTTTHPNIPTTTLPIEIPSFSTSMTSPPCLPLSTIDSAFSTTTMPQVSTMQQLPLGDMDITAEDLPRLLSEGTGLVVGTSNDGCDAPKLLDTSGDTTDLSEMLFKLQEATAGITHTQESNLGSQMYQVSVANHQLQGIHTHTHPGVGLTGQPFSQHAQHTNTLTHTETRQSVEPSMPILTFSGALNSDFHNTPSLSQVIGQPQDAKMQLSADFHSNPTLSQVISQAQETNSSDFHTTSTLSQVISQAQDSNKMQLNTDFHSSPTLSHVLGRGEDGKPIQMNADFHGSNALSQVMGEGGKGLRLDPNFHGESGLSQVMNRSSENKIQLNSTFHSVNRGEENKIQLDSNFHGGSGMSQVMNRTDETKIQLNPTFHSVNQGEENKIQLDPNFHGGSRLNQVMNRNDENKVQLNPTFHSVNQGEGNKIQLDSNFHGDSGLSQVMNRNDENKIQLNSTFHSVNQSEENKIQLDSNFHGGSGMSQVMNRSDENKIQLNPTFHSVNQGEENKIQLDSNFHGGSGMSQVMNRSDENKIQLNPTFHSVNQGEENKIQLDPNFHSDSGLSQVMSRSDENKIQLDPTFHSDTRSQDKKIRAILSEVTDHCGPSGQSSDAKPEDGEQIHLGFGTANLGMSTFEELLKS
ncbi:uncharacterized protein LOC126985214 isoform X5 [Eriocheir sinensis]|uniref:uncharacterized protein LOC126985214 isoform X5 n=1 Tax=Eriocheir sinensis TaxID=95602 RepID=UPI0021C61152|nr:uncharacterized protein LOC126985214 isoform X5 [Eriocheir sinensis]